jgi:DNA-binding NtrC family response regulator
MTVEDALHAVASGAGGSETPEPEAELPRFPGIIGESPAFREMLRRIARIAPTDAVILLEGETGVGKELAARAIHYSSARRSKPFVALNCGAIPESLVESELFGHARGAFTDAKVASPGVIRQAHGGTLFLDEIDTLPMKGQVAMLRFLQDHCYRTVGESAERVSDARIIAATNRSLQTLVDVGAFRNDLMYRLNIIRIQVPPLRERRGDILPLARHFLQLYGDQYGLARKALHAECQDWLLRYDWPGNVRELESMIHRSILLSDGDEILLDDPDAGTCCVACRPEGIDASPAATDAVESAPRTMEASTAEASAERGGSPAACAGPDDAPEPLQDFRSAKASAIAAFERHYLSQLLERTRGNVTAAARIARKERRSLGKLIKKLGLDRAMT